MTERGQSVAGLQIRDDEGRTLPRAVFLPCSDTYIIYNFLVQSARGGSASREGGKKKKKRADA